MENEYNGILMFFDEWIPGFHCVSSRLHENKERAD